MSRPPYYPQNNNLQPGPSSQPYQPYPAYQNPFLQQAYNLPNGYQPYQTYPNYPQPITQYQYPYQYNQPYPNQPYQHQTYQQPSFGQTLFQPKPTATPEGYSYSPTYLSQQPQQYGPGPSKRPRHELPDQNQNVNTVKAWRNCSQPGCKFVGSGEDVEVHEGDRHLIFPAGYKLERSEEEERYLKMKGGPPTIEGTGIRLETEEDIAKWIAERKSKWPSAKRVTEKAAERNAAIARGEVPRGRGRGRGRGGHQRDDAASRAEDWGREAVEADEGGEGGLRGQGRGRGRGQTRGRGGERGRGRGRGRGGHAQGEARDTDTGWPGHGAPIALPALVATHTATTPTLPTAIKSSGPLDTLVNYDSATSDTSESSSSLSDSSSDSSPDSDSETNNEDLDHAEEAKVAENLIMHALQADLNEDDEEAVEAGDDTEVKEEVGQEESAIKQVVISQKKVCKFFAKNGNCRAGEKCKFAHTLDSASGPGSGPIASGGPSQSGAPAITRRKVPRQPAAKAPNPFARPSMLSSLLDVPIQNTLSQLSQTIRFLVANDMLKNVELIPGQAAEEDKKKRKVELLDEDVTTHE